MSPIIKMMRTLSEKLEEEWRIRLSDEIAKYYRQMIEKALARIEAGEDLTEEELAKIIRPKRVREIFLEVLSSSDPAETMLFRTPPPKKDPPQKETGQKNRVNSLSELAEWVDKNFEKVEIKVDAMNAIKAVASGWQKERLSKIPQRLRPVFLALAEREGKQSFIIYDA